MSGPIKNSLIIETQTRLSKQPELTMLEKATSRAMAVINNSLPVQQSSVDNESDHLLRKPLLGEDNPAIRFLSRYIGKSKQTHTSRLRRIARLLGSPNQDYRYLDWTVFKAIRIESLLRDLQEPYETANSREQRSPNTLNGFLDSLKGVMRQAYKLDMITQREWSDIQEIKALPNNVPMAGRMASVDETQRIEAEIDQMAKNNPVKAARDRAIFRLAFLAGIRRHEFCNLYLSDYDLKHATIKVSGKGGKIVRLNINQLIIESLEHWISFRGDNDGALFYRVTKTGDILDKKLSEHGIRYLFKSYTLKLGLSSVLTPHDARRTFCSNVLDTPNIDPKTAMDLLRHSSFNTTASYDRRSGEKRKEVVDRLYMSTSNKNEA